MTLSNGKRLLPGFSSALTYGAYTLNRLTETSNRYSRHAYDRDAVVQPQRHLEFYRDKHHRNIIPVAMSYGCAASINR